MRNLSRGGAILSGLLLLACGGGDEGPGTQLRVAVQAQTELDTLQWTVIPDDPAQPIVQGGPEVVGRSPAELRDEPFEVRVPLEPGRHVVQLLGTSADGAPLGSLRCYTVDGVLSDEVLLVELTTLDQDDDGFPADTMSTCVSPSGLPCTSGRCEAGEGRDCDDADPALHPGAMETCGDGIDQDCDGADLPCADGGR